jgi:nucleotide-binding universal stress UspA family protein
MKVLLAVDGSPHSLGAVRYLRDQFSRHGEQPQIELVTVHRPVPMLPNMGKVIGKGDLERYYDEEGRQALTEAARLLDRAGVPYRSQVLVGEPGDAIVERAKEGGFDLVCVGTPAAWIGSTTYKVINRAEVPVLVVK